MSESVNVELITDPERFLSCGNAEIREPKNQFIVRMKRRSTNLRKPVYVNFSILELSSFVCKAPQSRDGEKICRSCRVVVRLYRQSGIRDQDRELELDMTWT